MVSSDEALTLILSPVRLWHTEDGSPDQMQDGGGVGGKFSSDDRLILTWSDDRTVQLCHTEDGSPAAQAMQHDAEVWDAVFSSDERLILTWSQDGTVRLWDISVDYDFPPEHLPLLVEVTTGTTMDDLGNITVLNADEWQKRRDAYLEIAEAHLKRCRYRDANLYVRQKAAWGR
ncbi:MAG: hypothetical protein GY856_12165 [bacterium]|nr:hypothetical protein [bacterium]